MLSFHISHMAQNMNIKFENHIKKIANKNSKDLLAKDCELIKEVITLIDKGSLRVASYDKSSDLWQVHEWVKQAILLYFKIAKILSEKIKKNTNEK